MHYLKGKGKMDIESTDKKAGTQLSWQEVVLKVRECMRIRHYSYNTEKTGCCGKSAGQLGESSRRSIVVGRRFNFEDRRGKSQAGMPVLL